MRDIGKGTHKPGKLPDGVSADDAQKWLDHLKALTKDIGRTTDVVEKRLPVIRDAIKKAGGG